MPAIEEKRLFVGGLVKDVTEEELVEKFSRFGQVSSVEIKKSKTEKESKTFAYLNLTAEENAFKKCFTAYNNTKWKGGQLKLQFAKESFLSKLKKEREAAKVTQEKKESKPASVFKSPALEGSKKAVPGTPLDEKGTWVMGKFSRVQPVLRLKKPGSGKLVTVDPSKMTHCLKKLKCEDFDSQQPSALTWHLEESTSNINKLRQGQFPTPQQHHSTPKEPSTLKQASLVSRLQSLVAEQQVSDTEMEVVPVGKAESVSKNRAVNGGYNSDDSAGSADTDEIVCKASGKKVPQTVAAKSVTVTVDKEKKKPVKSPLAGHAEDSACSLDVVTPSCISSSQNTPKSFPSGKKTQAKNKVDAENSNTEEKHKPQFEFVKNPKLKGKALKKSVKLSQSKTPKVGKGLVAEYSEVEDSRTQGFSTSGNKTPVVRTPGFKGLGMLSSDSEDAALPLMPAEGVGHTDSFCKSSSKKTPDSHQNWKATGVRKKPEGAGRTPEFRGLSMLSSDSDSDVPANKSAEMGESKGQSTAKTIATLKGAKAVSSVDQKRLKGAKGVFPPLELKNSGKDESSDSDDTDDILSANKETPVTTQTTRKQKTKKVTHSSKERSTSKETGLDSRTHSQQKNVQNSLDTEITSENRKQKPPVSVAVKGVSVTELSYEFRDGLGTDTSFPTSQINQKKLKPAWSDDSDLDDNDFEKVGRKLAARALQQDKRKQKTGLLKGQHEVATKDTHNMPRKRTGAQAEEGSLTAMQKSHQAFSKVQKKKKEEENLVTKALREGAESKVIKFQNSDSEDEEEKPANKMTLFSESDSGSEVDFSVRPQFEGRKGKKLFELQSRIMDKRFRFDERFESDNEGDESGESDNNMKQDEDSEDDLAAERSRQLQILEKILGYKPRQRTRPLYEPMSKRRYNEDTAAQVTIVPQAEPEKRAKKMRNSNEDIAEITRVPQAEPEESKIAKKKRNSDEDTAEITRVPQAEPEESKIGKQDEESAEQDKNMEVVTEKVCLKGLFEVGSKFTLFGSEDSGDVEEPVTFSQMDEDVEKQENVEEDDNQNHDEEHIEVDNRHAENKTPALNGIRVPDIERVRLSANQQPSFMVARDDPRLIAALRFFKRRDEEEFEELSERWAEERQKTMELVKERHKKAMRKQRTTKERTTKKYTHKYVK